MVALAGELARVKQAVTARFAYVDAELLRLREEVPDLAARVVEPIHDRIDRLRPGEVERLAARVADLEETVRQLRRELAEQDQRSRAAMEATEQLVGALAGG